MTTILVTGGAGFIGSNFIDWIHRTREDICVVNLDKLTYAGDPANLEGISRGSAYHFVQGDICDAPVVEGIFREYDIDAVFHFAAESHVDRSIRDSAVFVRTNVLGTQTLLEAARQAWEREDDSFRPGKRFLYVSTDEVYGSLEADEAPSRETSFCRPNNPYAASKAAGDLLVSSYIHTYGFPANVTHCGNNYGPRQHREKFLPTVIRNLLEGKEIPVYGDGRNIRDWIYVEDHVRALEMIWEKGKPGEIYNIGASCERQNLEMIREVCQVMEEEGTLMPSGGRITFVEDRKGHDRRYALDPGKIRQLGWRPKTGLREGLQKTVEWYLKEGDSIMGKATLVVMAAGIGSRYGGIKQLAQVGPKGEMILDYAVQDAMEAGFDKVVFVIRKDLEEIFREKIGRRVEPLVETVYVYQEIQDVPGRYQEKAGNRKKPWGTGQAVLCCRDVVAEPFLVINSDDYYGKEAYREAYACLTQEKEEKGIPGDGKLDLCMVGFVLGNTLSENGGVTRGICDVTPEGFLQDITETRHIVKTEEGAAVETDEGLQPVDASHPVSMNMWGLTPEIFPILEAGFDRFLDQAEEDGGTGEYLLPDIIDSLLRAGKVRVKVLWSHEQWLGVTYQEDKAWVERALQKIRQDG